jgi:hypothetical protein
MPRVPIRPQEKNPLFPFEKHRLTLRFYTAFKRGSIPPKTAVFPPSSAALENEKIPRFKEDFKGLFSSENSYLSESLTAL